MSRFAGRVRAFARSEEGGALDYLLVVGVISIPLVIFLSIFGKNIVDWVKQHGPNIFNEAENWIQ